MISANRILIRINLVIIISYFVVKFIIRPYVFQHNYQGLLHTFVFSYPNFCEAVFGTIVLTYIFLWLNYKFFGSESRIKENAVYLFSVIIAGIYVITQEFKAHNIGGVNVYDPYDVLFSVIGLILTFFLLIGLKPKIKGT